MTLEISAIKTIGSQLIAILGLSAPAVGVRLLPADSEVPENVERLNGYRYCQALMAARHGRAVVLDSQGISCPAAAAAFGFRPLPKNLANGKALVGFGIVADEAVGRRMFETMVTLRPGRIQQLQLFPLDQAMEVPDVVVIEDQVEKLMWLNLAYLHVTGGERILSSTAVLQATCVDSTIIPYVECRLNFSYGCYGFRDATNIDGSETVVGFPATLLPAMMEHLEYLNQKAIPTSRAKKALASLRKRAQRADEIEA